MSDVLVTGGAGFIGSNTVDLLIESGYSVSIIDDMSTGKSGNLNPKAKLYEMDICSERVFDVLMDENPKYVIHLAAQINVRPEIGKFD